MEDPSLPHTLGVNMLLIPTFIVSLIGRVILFCLRKIIKKLCPICYHLNIVTVTKVGIDNRGKDLRTDKLQQTTALLSLLLNFSLRIWPPLILHVLGTPGYLDQTNRRVLGSNWSSALGTFMRLITLQFMFNGESLRGQVEAC